MLRDNVWLCNQHTCDCIFLNLCKFLLRFNGKLKFKVVILGTFFFFIFFFKFLKIFKCIPKNQLIHFCCLAYVIFSCPQSAADYHQVSMLVIQLYPAWMQSASHWITDWFSSLKQPAMISLVLLYHDTRQCTSHTIKTNFSLIVGWHQ